MNNKGFGLLGMLLAVLIIGILMTAMLKQYAGQTRRILEMPGLVPGQVEAPAKNGGAKKSAGKKNGQSVRQTQPAAPKCNGRQVGNICVPTEIRSSSLDAFDKMEQ